MKRTGHKAKLFDHQILLVEMGNSYVLNDWKEQKKFCSARGNAMFNRVYILASQRMGSVFFLLNISSHQYAQSVFKSIGNEWVWIIHKPS